MVYISTTLLMTLIGAVLGGVATYYATIKMIRVQIHKEIILPFVSTLLEMYRIVEIYSDGDIDDYFVFYFQNLYRVLVQILFDRGGLFLVLNTLNTNKNSEDNLKLILQPIRAIQYELIRNKQNPEKINNQRISEIFHEFLKTREQFENIKNKLLKKTRLR